MIRAADDEERAVKFLTKIVLNLIGDKMALDAVLKATENEPMH